MNWNLIKSWVEKSQNHELKFVESWVEISQNDEYKIIKNIKRFVYYYKKLNKFKNSYNVMHHKFSERKNFRDFIQCGPQKFKKWWFLKK